MTATDGRFTERLLAFLDRAPTPYHAAQELATRLVDSGFSEINESSDFPGDPGRYVLRRGASIAAWATSDATDAHTGFRIIGAHTDSPNLRVKPQPDTESVGYNQLGVEIYGGALLNSWLDRDLGLAGRVAIRDGANARTALFHDARPLLRIPQLAIHLDRRIGEKGLLLDPQRHMSPVWGLGEPREFVGYLAEQIGAEASEILAWDVMTFDTTPARLGGVEGEFLLSGRIDNLLSCFVAVESLLDVVESPGRHIPMICLFDHEEVGSVSATGAGGPLLHEVITRIGSSLGGGVRERARAGADSIVVSADGAHATHPNYVERHDPDHLVHLNAGPVLKVNANQRYGTDAGTAAEFRIACLEAGVPMQVFVSRNDLPCGSTIGPLTSGRTGMAVLDAGCAQLSMHSARETAGTADPEWFRDALSMMLLR